MHRRAFEMGRSWFAVVCLMAWPSLSVAQNEPAPAVPATEVTPKTAVVDVVAPAGTRLRVEGVDKGEKRELVFGEFSPNRAWVFLVEAEFPDGKIERRKLQLQGGWRVTLDFTAPTRPDVVYQTGHSSQRINTVAFHPGGTMLLTGGDDKNVALWDVKSGRQLAALQSHEMGSVMSSTFTPDGRLALVGSYGGKVHGWDVETAKITTTFKIADKAISGLAIAPTGEWFVALAADATLSAWDLRTQQQRWSKKLDNPTASSVVIDAKGERILTGARDGAILWNAATGEQLSTVKQDGGVRAVAFAGDRLVTASGSDAQLWDPDGTKVGKTFTGHGEEIVALAANREGTLVLTASADRTARVWDATTGQEVAIFEGHSAAISTIAISPDGRYAATGAADTSAAIWEARTGKPLVSLRGNVTAVNSTAFSFDGRELLATSEDGTAAVWDLHRGLPVQSLERGEGRPNHCGFSRDGRLMVVGYEKTAIIWDRATGVVKKRIQIPQGDLRCVALSPDGRILVTVAKDHSPSVWDVESGEFLRSLVGHSDRIHTVAISPDGRRVGTASYDRTAMIWDIQTSQRLLTLTGHENSLGGIAFSRDGSRVATTGLDLQTIVWDATTGRRLAAMKGRPEYLTGVALAFSPDGTKVLTTYCANRAVLWDTATEKAVHELVGHTSCVWTCDYSRDGRHLMTGSRDGTARLWDAATGQEVVRLIQVGQGRDWLAVTPDGYFDGSPVGTEQVSLRPAGTTEAMPVDRFRQHYSRPGLLAAVLKGRLPDVVAATATPAVPVPAVVAAPTRPMPAVAPEHPAVRPDKRKPPRVRFIAPASSGTAPVREVEIEIEAVDQGGGVKPESLRLTHNGVTRRAVGPATGTPKAQRRTFRVTLLDGENRFAATATSQDGDWESEPAGLTLHHGSNSSRGTLHLLVVGINRYAQEAMNLTFARPDAEAIADLFTSRGRRLFQAVQVTRLLDQNATRDGIRTALKSLAEKAGPQDTVIVYFAGHGLMVGQLYYLIPHDFRRQADSIDEDVREQGVAASVITEEMTALKSTRQVLILDACASGGLLGPAGASRGGLEFRGAVERLGRSSGVFTLAAAAASDDAKEVPELKHGVLTYCLLAAVRAVDHGDLRDRALMAAGADGAADVLSWFNYARGQVPRLTRKYCGHEQQVQSFGRGTSFPLIPLED